MLSFTVVSGRYRGHNRHGNARDHRFAYARSGSFAEMDLDWNNGALHLGSRRGGYTGTLVVDGRVAVEAPQQPPGHTRLLTMLEQGVPQLARAAVETTETTYDGRPAVREVYEDGGMRGEVLRDDATGLAVRMRLGHEVAAITDLRVDDEVDAGLLVPPTAKLDRWRGGVVHLDDHGPAGTLAGSWEPRSGPGSLYLLSPEALPRAEALAWAFARSDQVYVREGGGRPRRVRPPGPR